MMLSQRISNWCCDPVALGVGFKKPTNDYCLQLREAQPVVQGHYELTNGDNICIPVLCMNVKRGPGPGYPSSIFISKVHLLRSS